MSEQTYNGWTNYETWNVKLWLDNEQSSYNDMQELAEEYRGEEPWKLGDAIQEYVEQFYPDLDASMFSDLLRSAFDEVNWREIAEEYLEDLPDEDEGEDEDEDMSCDQCEAAMINGVYCHETGCPNAHKIKVDGCWVIPGDEYED